MSTTEQHFENHQSSIIELHGVLKQYKMGKNKINALNHINLHIDEGEFVLILGPSGSGKTTLLNQIGGIDIPDQGEVKINGVDITKLSRKKLSKYRAKTVGWVFQFFNLIPSLTALENVCLGLELARDMENIESRSSDMLSTLGLKEFINHFPSELSGGQQQRVAMARALVKQPVVIIADEPTGNLDKKTGKDVINMMKKLNEEQNITFVVVSHDSSLKEIADRILYIEDGSIIKEEVR